MYSNLEFNTTKNALYQGYRSDNRKFNEPRDLKITFSQSPGFVLVKLGKTMITARTTAYLDVPPPSSPNKGHHIIKVYGPPFIRRSEIDTFQTALRMIWRAINALEEDTLCVKIGEKVWKLTTQVVINDRDGGLFDASIIAIYASLSQLCFPSFDTSTGNLYPPSQRRTHKVAFSIKPICITVAFINEKTKEPVKNEYNEYNYDIEEEEEEAEEEKKDINENKKDEENEKDKIEKKENKKSTDDDEVEEEEEESREDTSGNLDDKNAKTSDSKPNKASENTLPPRRRKQKRVYIQPKKYIIVDPTAIEMDASCGYATFIITEHHEQVYLLSRFPGNLKAIDEAREAAIEASKKWRKVIEDEIKEFNKKYNLEGLPCVGEPADFIDYKPPASNLGNLNFASKEKVLDNINEFKLWEGETKEKFVIDFFKFVQDGNEANDNQGSTQIAEGEDWLHSSLIVK